MESKATDEGLQTLQPLLAEIKERLIKGKYEFENQDFHSLGYVTGNCNFGNFILRCAFNDGGYICHHNSLGDYLSKIMTSTDEKKACKLAWEKSKVNELESKRDRIQSALDVMNKNLEKLRTNGNAI